MYYIAIILIIYLLIPLWGLISERKVWNNGICAKTGKPWEYFDTDAYGTRGYKSGTYTCWITWSGIDEK